MNNHKSAFALTTEGRRHASAGRVGLVMHGITDRNSTPFSILPFLTSISTVPVLHSMSKKPPLLGDVSGAS